MRAMLRHPRPLAALTAAAVAVFAAGCGGDEDSTPVACLEGAPVYLAALQDAPADVTLDGDVPISDCLAANQTGGDLAEVGTAMLAAATELNAEARAQPGGASNLQLGYLLGAAQRGAASSEGIHAELIRRLSAAARYSPDNQPLPAQFLPAYREGFDAGRDQG
jgi:hypothetical protein